MPHWLVSIDANHNKSTNTTCTQWKKKVLSKTRLWSTSLRQALKMQHWSHLPIFSTPPLKVRKHDGIWMVWSQKHPNVLYKLQSPFTEYASCTCEWAICGNLCKQVLVLLTSTNIIQENIEHCGTWFGSNWEGFQAMYIGLGYLQLDDGASNDENNEDFQVKE